jgi:transposase-like zinc ribbon protein
MEIVRGNSVDRLLSKYDQDIAEFESLFKDEVSCSNRLFDARWGGGIKCPCCGYDWVYTCWGKNVYECWRCRYQFSYTAGTLFHGTRTPLKVWYYMIFIMGLLGGSKVPLQHFIEYRERYVEGKSHYNTVKNMAGKIVEALKTYGDAYPTLVGYFSSEVDEIRSEMEMLDGDCFPAT